LQRSVPQQLTRCVDLTIFRFPITGYGNCKD